MFNKNFGYKAIYKTNIKQITIDPHFDDDSHLTIGEVRVI